MKKVVLAYSGGLDTSVAIPWLAERGYDVVAIAVDVGQPGDLARAAERAGRLGATVARVVDLKERFAEQFCFKALRMNALYQSKYPLVSALSRPLIAEALVEAASDLDADAVAHGCTGKGNDQVRFEVSLGALAPDLEVLAPVRDWDMDRAAAIDYARRRDLPIETDKSSPYSIDENLWGRSIECGVLEDPWEQAPRDVFALTSDPEGASGTAEIVVGFEKSLPVTLDGETLEPAALIQALTKIAGSFGFGRVDMVEDRLVGIKSREIYEAPAALALTTAHRDLEELTLERSLLREKRRLEDKWTELVYEGLWFSPLRGAIEAFASVTEPCVTGEVRLRLGPGSCAAVGRRSPYSLYSKTLATYDEQDAFNHEDAAGFVRLWGLPARRWAETNE
ncbi:MAG: argininosuccinate synthase [Actinomycetota bacterium]|nr:argininosuccinate synthase [Actinomycetota bacterium]